jgi:threonine dehydratase
MPDTADITSDRLVSLAEMRDAQRLIAGRVHRTPLLSSATAAHVIRASTGVAIADGRLYLKAEHLQRTGSFKARGALAKLATLTDDERRRGVVTLSAGNAAQAYAWAGAQAHVPVTVVMPAAAVRSKVDACLGYGAEVVLHGATMSETAAHLEHIRETRGLVFVPPFNDPHVIAGAGTAGIELVDDLPEVDVVVVGVGGGGLISGIAGAVKQLRPSTRVYGVEPVTSNAVSLGLAAGRVVPLQPASVADGLNAPYAGDWTLAMVGRHVDRVIELDDATILGGLRFLLERTKQVVEPAAAAGVAALLYGHVPLRAGDRVAAILSGGNIDLTRIGEFVAAAAPLPAL